MQVFGLSLTINSRLIVEAACLSNHLNDPAPNLPIISVTREDGTPFKGLKKENFVVVSYKATNGFPLLLNVEIVELNNELGGGFAGVYKCELPGDERDLTAVVGQNVYAIKVSVTSDENFPFRTEYSGQTVAAAVMQPAPV